MCKICLLISGHLFEEAKLNRLFTKIAKFDPHNKFWESTSDVHNYFFKMKMLMQQTSFLTCLLSALKTLHPLNKHKFVYLLWYEVVSNVEAFMKIPKTKIKFISIQ